MDKEFQKQVEWIIEKYGKKNAITYMRNDDTEDKMTFGEIGDFLKKQKCFFEQKGLRSGDRVAIVFPHSPWAIINILALSYTGITSILIDASLPIEEIQKLVDFSDVRALLSSDAIMSRFKENILEQQMNFCIGEKGELCLFHNQREDCLKQKITTDPEMDVIAVLFSSGTTGEMKGIKVTYESVRKARNVFERLSGLKDYMSYLLVLPFNHIAGYTGAMTYFLTGCEIGFIEDVNASKLQYGLKKFQPYYFAMVPKVYEVMEQKIRNAIHEKGKAIEITILSLMKLSGFLRKNFGINIGRKVFKNITEEVFGKNIFGIGTGASPCKASTTEFYLNLGLEWANLYATTETSVPITATGVYNRYPVGTVGNVNHNPEVKIRIANPDPEGLGEIQVKSELMMKGYFRQPKLTEDAFEDGYFKTGDYGTIDKKGYLHIKGRMKESIVLSNGKKVSPVDVDEYYMSKYPEHMIACRGIPAEEGMADDIHLFVEEASGKHLIQEKIKQNILEISKNAPSMYQCKQIHFIKQIPLTSVGKVKRYLLNSEMVEEEKEIPPKDQDNGKKRLLDIITKYCSNIDIDLNSRIKEDLGIDSLTMFEMVCEIENEFHKNIENQLGGIGTIGDLLKCISGEREEAHNEYNISDFPIQRSTKMIQSLRRWMYVSRLCYRFSVRGEKNIPLKENYLICSNHFSYLDPIWIITAMDEYAPDLTKICCLAAKHTMKGRFSNRLFKMLGCIPVDREGNTVPVLNRTKECLQNGDTVIIFPEGARSRDGSMLPFKNGVAKISIDTKKQILPVRIDGGFEIYPRHKKVPQIFNWKKFKRYELTIQFGEPISPEGKSVETLTNELRNVIERMNSHEYRN